MWGAILSFVTGFAGKLLANLFGIHKDPTPVDLADSNARAQERLGQQEAENAVITTADSARIDADARVLRIAADTGIKSSPNAPVTPLAEQAKRQFPVTFRD